MVCIDTVPCSQCQAEMCRISGRQHSKCCLLRAQPHNHTRVTGCSTGRVGGLAWTCDIHTYVHGFASASGLGGSGQQQACKCRRPELRWHKDCSCLAGGLAHAAAAAGQFWAAAPRPIRNQPSTRRGFPPLAFSKYLRHSSSSWHAWTSAPRTAAFTPSHRSSCSACSNPELRISGLCFFTQGCANPPPRIRHRMRQALERSRPSPGAPLRRA